MITLNRFFKNEVEEAETIQKMFKFGGSFVKALAEAYECADPINKGKLLIAFTNYFDEYKKNFNDN